MALGDPGEPGPFPIGQNFLGLTRGAFFDQDFGFGADVNALFQLSSQAAREARFSRLAAVPGTNLPASTLRPVDLSASFLTLKNNIAARRANAINFARSRGFNVTEQTFVPSRPAQIQAAGCDPEAIVETPAGPAIQLIADPSFVERCGAQIGETVFQATALAPGRELASAELPRDPGFVLAEGPPGTFEGQSDFRIQGGVGVGQSAQVPGLPGSRDDPSGFDRIIRGIDKLGDIFDPRRSGLPGF